MNLYNVKILELVKSEVKPNLTPRLDFHFLNPETFAMIRIWNFNRNRVHANRGVKDIVIELDKKVKRSKIAIVNLFNQNLSH